MDLRWNKPLRPPLRRKDVWYTGAPQHRWSWGTDLLLAVAARFALIADVTKKVESIAEGPPGDFR